MPDDERDTFGLVMPFVVTTGQGGPYDSAAFVAGCRFEADAAELKAAPHTLSWANYVYPAMVPQYDLLAMHHGFVMTAEPWAEYPDEWVLVTFTRPEEVVTDGD